MPEHLRALVFILAIGLTAHVIAARLLSLVGVNRGDLVRRRNAWFVITLAAFLSYNFWIYVVVAGLVAWRFGRKDPNPASLYVVLLAAVPSFEKMIPGLGPIDFLFSIGHHRVLALALLLPAALRLRVEHDDRPRTLTVTDLLVAGFLLWVGLRHLLQEPLTLASRQCFYLLIDAWLPYYVVSRSVSTFDRLRDLAAAIALSGLLVAAVAAFEVMKGWQLYESLRAPWAVQPDPLVYLVRGADGPLRARATLMHPITTGLFVAIGLIFLVALLKPVQRSLRKFVALGVAAAGLIGSMSRGPWLGAAFGLVAYALAGRKGFGRTAKLGFLSLTVVVVLSLTPFGGKIASYLPFVGTVDSQNVKYRERLIEVSLLVIAQHPWAGDVKATANPLMETMRQGQGIIDVTNTYLYLALYYGLVGSVLFIAAFLSASLIAWLNARRLSAAGSNHGMLVRATLGALACMMLTLATVSPIGITSMLYWLLAGIAVASARCGGADLRAPSTSDPTRATPPAESGSPAADLKRNDPSSTVRSGSRVPATR